MREWKARKEVTNERWCRGGEAGRRRVRNAPEHASVTGRRHTGSRGWPRYAATGGGDLGGVGGSADADGSGRGAGDVAAALLPGREPRPAWPGSRVRAAAERSAAECGERSCRPEAGDRALAAGGRTAAGAGAGRAAGGGTVAARTGQSDREEDTAAARGPRAQCRRDVAAGGRCGDPVGGRR